MSNKTLHNPVSATLTKAVTLYSHKGLRLKMPYTIPAGTRVTVGHWPRVLDHRTGQAVPGATPSAYLVACYDDRYFRVAAEDISRG